MVPVTNVFTAESEPMDLDEVSTFVCKKVTHKEIEFAESMEVDEIDPFGNKPSITQNEFDSFRSCKSISQSTGFNHFSANKATSQSIGFNPFATNKKPTIPQVTGFNPFARHQNQMMEVDQIVLPIDLLKPDPMEIDVEDPMDLFFRPSKFFKLDPPPPPIVFKKQTKEIDASKNSGMDEVAIFFGDHQLVKTGFLAPGFFNPKPENILPIRSKYSKKRKSSGIVHEKDDVIESVNKRRCSNIDRSSNVSGELSFFRGIAVKSFDGNSQSVSQEEFIAGKDCSTTELNKNINSYENLLASRQRM